MMVVVAGDSRGDAHLTFGVLGPTSQPYLGGVHYFHS